jgi:hypothetical protein
MIAITKFYIHYSVSDIFLTMRQIKNTFLVSFTQHKNAAFS